MSHAAAVISSRSDGMMVARPLKAGLVGQKDVLRRVATLDTGDLMANTYTCLHYHFVFSTKNRHPWIGADVEERVWEYLGGIARRNGMKAIKVGGIEDHVHVVVGAPATWAPSKIVQLLKGGSSAWIHETFPSLAGFEWQDGYGAFTVSRPQLPRSEEHTPELQSHSFISYAV